MCRSERKLLINVYVLLIQLSNVLVLTFCSLVLFYLVSFQAVEFMRQGKSPSEAATLALGKIARYYPKYSGGLVVVNKDGEFGWLTFICVAC